MSTPAALSFMGGVLSPAHSGGAQFLVRWQNHKKRRERKKGRKRHIVVDTMGNLLAVVVHAANIHDTNPAGFPKIMRYLFALSRLFVLLLLFVLC